MANKVGRPKKEIDYKLVIGMSSVMATQQEIANELDISVRTLQRDQEFCRIYKKGIDIAKVSLRRKQFLLADTNATMGIWLGKQYLDQHDKKEIEHSGAITNKYEELTNEELEKEMKKYEQKR